MWTVVACSGASSGAPAISHRADPVPAIPRARYIQCPSHALGADLERSPEGTTYVGHGRDNYEETKYASCSYTPSQIVCDGAWSFSNTSSRMVITLARDGTLVARVQSPAGGTNELPCVARDQTLSNDCIFNPHTPSCHEAPWAPHP